MDSAITALIVVNDTSAQTQETIHGKLEFLQLVGITEPELNVIKEDYTNINKLIELMKKDNPEFVTDMNRSYSYL